MIEINGHIDSNNEVCGKIEPQGNINVQIIGSGPSGYTPIKGVDYFTQEDIDEIIAEVLAEGGGDLTYVHDQILSSQIWTVNHNLGKYPSIMIINSAGTVAMGDVTYINENQIIVTFSATFSGKAYCN